VKSISSTTWKFLIVQTKLKNRMTSIKQIANNSKAFHDYTILEKLEVGVSLMGYEVKSIRAGHVSLKEGYVRPFKNELWLMGCHMRPYNAGGQFTDIDPMRNRKLLLHKFELKKWTEKVNEKGLAIIPLSLYFRNNKVKLEIGLAKGKKLHDKRESIKERDIQREIMRSQKNR